MTHEPLPGRWRTVGSWVLSSLTLGGLCLVGWYGHHTHWTFGLAGAGHDDGHHAEAHVAEPHVAEAHVAEAHVAEAHGAAHGDAAATPPQTPPSPAKPGPAAAAGTAAAPAPREPAAAAVTPDGGPLGAVTFDDAADVERAGIETIPVRTQAMSEIITANGVVRYDERRIAQLSVRAPGIVWRVEKRLGDAVRQGEVLVIVDSADVGRLKAELLTALVVYESRRESLAILEEIRSAVMGRQLREARSAMREARNTLTNAEQALVNLGFDVSVEDLAPLDDETRAERMRVLGLPPALLVGLDKERISSNLLPLRAPFDGIVIGRDVVVGEIADPSRSIFEIVDLSNMWIVLNVAKEDASRLAIGQRITFRPDGDIRDYASTIAWISTEVEPTTRTLQVRADVPTNHAATTTERLAGLRANAFGRGTIEIAVREEARVVPTESVQAIGSDWVVFVPTGETTFEARPVAKGLETDGTVELLGGARELTHIVGPGSHVLKSQLLLELVESGKL